MKHHLYEIFLRISYMRSSRNRSHLCFWHTTHIIPSSSSSFLKFRITIVTNLWFPRLTWISSNFPPWNLLDIKHMVFLFALKNINHLFLLPGHLLIISPFFLIFQNWINFFFFFWYLFVEINLKLRLLQQLLLYKRRW